MAATGRRLNTLLRRGFRVTDLATVRRMIVALAGELGLRRDRAVDLSVATNEVTANAVKYAGGGQLAILQDAESSVVIEVSDDGPGIPAELSQDLPSPEATGGRGLWLARALCDRVDIATGPTGTRVRLEMRIDQAV